MYVCNFKKGMLSIVLFGRLFFGLRRLHGAMWQHFSWHAVDASPRVDKESRLLPGLLGSAQ